MIYYFSIEGPLNVYTPHAPNFLHKAKIIKLESLYDVEIIFQDEVWRYMNPLRQIVGKRFKALYEAQFKLNCMT